MTGSVKKPDYLLHWRRRHPFIVSLVCHERERSFDAGRKHMFLELHQDIWIRSYVRSAYFVRLSVKVATG